MKVAVEKLVPSELSLSIYDHTPPPDLVESVKTHGVLVPPVVSESSERPGCYIIEAGNRRVNAAKQAGLTEIEVEVKAHSDIFVIESNRYRKKSKREVAAELEALREILAPKAAARMKAGKKDLGRDSDQGRTDEKLARVVGESRDAVQKISALAEKAPELLKLVDEGKESLDSAHKKLKSKQSAPSALTEYQQALYAMGAMFGQKALQAAKLEPREVKLFARGFLDCLAKKAASVELSAFGPERIARARAAEKARNDHAVSKKAKKSAGMEEPDRLELAGVAKDSPLRGPFPASSSIQDDEAQDAEELAIAHEPEEPENPYETTPAAEDAADGESQTLWPQ